MLCFSLNTPGLHCKEKGKKKKKKGKFNFKRYQSSQSKFATETRRCSGVLEKSSRDRLHLNAIDLVGRSASLLIFDLSKEYYRSSAAFRRTGKRYELPGCVGRFEQFRRSRSGGKRARGSVRRCKASVQITENERSAIAYYSNHGKYSFGSAIFDYSRIFEQFVSTLVKIKQVLLVAACL